MIKFREDEKRSDGPHSSSGIDQGQSGSDVVDGIEKKGVKRQTCTKSAIDRSKDLFRKRRDGARRTPERKDYDH